MNNQDIQFSCSVVSNSLQPHGLQHARLPYPLSQFTNLRHCGVFNTNSHFLGPPVRVILMLCLPLALSAPLFEAALETSVARTQAES